MLDWPTTKEFEIELLKVLFEDLKSLLFAVTSRDHSPSLDKVQNVFYKYEWNNFFISVIVLINILNQIFGSVITPWQSKISHTEHLPHEN